MILCIVAKFDQLFALAGRNGITSAVASDVLEEVKFPVIPIVIWRHYNRFASELTATASFRTLSISL